MVTASRPTAAAACALDGRPWRLLLVAVVLVAVAAAAPFPAHLVVGGRHPGHHQHDPPHAVTWQEYPVALHPLNNSGAAFRPILPGTDHGLYNKGFFEGDILRGKGRTEDEDAAETQDDPNTKNAVTDPNLLWPFATVVYKVDDDVGCPESPQCAILMAAMDHYHENSCIRFKQWTGEDNWVSIFFNSDSSGACWSPVGRVGDGEQRLSLGQRCWYKGIVIHELGHAMGFWHEMNRPDRDDWIYVYWQNIIPGFASAFRKHQQVATLGEHFDYRSIMMYDEYAFSKDGRSATLQATTGEEIGPIWRKKGLSASDKRRIEKLYKCDPKKPKSGFPYDVNCDFNRHVCGFKNGGSANWNWRTVNQTDGYVYTSFDTAGTAPGHFLSINFPPISGALESVRGELGCVRFYYLIETDGEAQLILDQAYLKKVTQLNHDEATTFELWSNDTSSNEWIHMEIPLYVTRPFKLIFTSSFNGSATHGTIALDDVELLYTPCNPTAAANSAANSSSSSSSSSAGQVMPSAPRPAKPRPIATTTTAAPETTPSATASTPTTTPGNVEAEDTSAASLPSSGGATEGQAATATTTPTPTTAATATTESTTSFLPLMSTVESEEAIQQMQVQQQQDILQAQQLLEQQQQKEQQQQLLAMAQHLQQHVDFHSSKKPHKGKPQHTTPPPNPASTTFPTYQTVATVTEASGGSGGDAFPIVLSESYDSSHKVPNLPDPTDRIPLKNPNPRPTAPTNANKMGEVADQVEAEAKVEVKAKDEVKVEAENRR